MGNLNVELTATFLMAKRHVTHFSRGSAVEARRHRRRGV